MTLGLDRPLRNMFGWKQTRLIVMQHSGFDVFSDLPQGVFFRVILCDTDMSEDALAYLAIPADEFNGLNGAPW